MKNKQIVGIDVSKSTLDAFIFKSNHLFQVANNPNGFVRLLQESFRFPDFQKILYFFVLKTPVVIVNLFLCFFRMRVSHFMLLMHWILSGQWVFPGENLIKKMPKQLPCMPGAGEMSWFAQNFRGPVFDQLSALLSHREMLIKQRTALKNANKGHYNNYSENEFKFLKESQMRMIKQISEEIKITESEIIFIINHNAELKSSFDLLLSIMGIGKILAFYLITLTHNFTKFTNPRKFACYAGIAPLNTHQVHLLRAEPKFIPVQINKSSPC